MISRLLKTGDVAIFYPFRGRKREIKINRSNYMVEGVDEGEFQFENFTFKIPVERGQVFHGEISQHFREPDGYHYRITSKQGRYFELNGSYVSDALLSIGDEVRVGYNRIRFRDESRKINNTSIEEISNTVAQSDLNIFLQGETGSGKTRMARIIHEASGRQGRFVHLNLSSFSKGLFESELFGHRKGAFTGAINDHLGAIFEAREGTLFLDEIDSLEKDQQKKLLLFLDSKTYRQVGATGEKKSNCRLIFSSGKEVSTLLKTKSLREDFYYRLTSEYCHRLAPLREQKELIKDFIYSFLTSRFMTIKSSLLEFYLRYSWPGNYRQLQGHLNKKCILTRTNILELDETDEELRNGQLENHISIKEINKKTFREIKNEIFHARLNFFDGRADIASESLGVSKATIERVLGTN